MIGRLGFNPVILLDSNNSQFQPMWMVIIKIRLPRIIGAIIIGASLAVTGATFQAIFKNPLVSPNILGSSNASAFGIALGIVLNLNYVNTVLIAFVLGILAVVISYGLSRLFRNDKTFGLILAGIMVSTIFSSLLSYIKLIADTENELPDITYWLMGKLNSITMDKLLYSMIPISIAIVLIFILRWKINLFSVGEMEAKTMGLNVELIKIILVFSSTLITATVVSLCGVIGFVGLVVPHLARMLIGHDYKHVIPISILMGAIFLLLVDDFARTLSTYEIPIGILTSLIGAPIFILLLVRGRRD